MLEMRTITVHSYRIRNRKYLHPDDGVDKEEHHDEQSYMRESLRTEHRHSHALTLSRSRGNGSKTSTDDGG